MRRIIANVPMTYAYTVCAGIWKLAENLNTNKTDININTFVKLVKTYDIATGKYFDHVMELIKDQDKAFSYYIANNGVTNMIGPMIRLVNKDDTKYMSRILRALYSYEVYQALKRQFKGKDNMPTLVTELLNKLVGIDYDTYKTQTAALFEEENPKFYNNYHIDKDEHNAQVKLFWYADYLTLLPDLLNAAKQPDPVAAIRKIPQMDEKTICQALDIKYDVKIFKFFNIIQCLIHNSKDKRVDSDNNKMKIIDLDNYENAEMMVKEYVRKYYVDKYSSDIREKNKKEYEELIGVLVEQLAKTDSIETFNKLLSIGTSRNKISVKIANSSGLGYMDLKTNLLDLTTEVPHRVDKLRVLLLARDVENNNVWNNGNVLYTSLEDFENVFIQLKQEEMWKTIYTEYQQRNIHIYRELANRHGHSNSKPSYWAFGYRSIEEMMSNITRDEWINYKELHKNCCGISRLII